MNQTATLRQPAAGRPIPVSTYRLQLSAAFTLDDALGQVPYLAQLGVTHLYLSPVLTAAPGSTHGYDVVDHSTVSEVLGGRSALERLSASARQAGLGLILDLVPNHMAVPTPAAHNRELWSVLAEGPESPYANWFDVDWSAGEGTLLMPILGQRIGEVLASDELELLRMQPTERLPEQTVLRYYEHLFPVRKGTEDLPMAELLERQHYRLAWWKIANEELNYRRFFDVDTLAAIRVEQREVFDATHRVFFELIDAGIIDGLRVDHPDGLADPRHYLQWLAEGTQHSWVAVEKILSPDEPLPDDWATVGTTGYDAMWRIHATFIDPAGAADLSALQHRLADDPADGLEPMIESAKRQIIDGPLQAEVHRLTTLAAELCHGDIRLRDHSWWALYDCLVELLVAADRYRYYVVPGEPMHGEPAQAFSDCIARAREHLHEDRHDTLQVISLLLQGQEAGSAGRTQETLRHELKIRFQQTCGAIMAKGVEDTAFYRWTHLISLCEVGGAPERFAISTEELHAWASDAQRSQPYAMTAMSTHDTKRHEDVRMRLGVLSERAPEWCERVEQLRTISSSGRPALLDGRTENLIWQTLAGTWTEAGPISDERLCEYLTKAMREAKTHTFWTGPDADYEQAVLEFAVSMSHHSDVITVFEDWVQTIADDVRVATLGIKLVQLTLPGVADVYQGTEIPAIALVDPDNRRPVDFASLANDLKRLDDGASPRGLADEKLMITARALRVRREHADAFVSEHAGYAVLPASSDHAFAFARLHQEQPVALAIATRLSVSLQRFGGWQEHSVVLPPGEWRCVLSGKKHRGGSTLLAVLLDELPVALLVRA